MKLLAATAVALSVLGFAGVAQAQQAGKLFFEGDIVRGEQDGAPGPFCVLNSQFKRLEKVVWRLRVLDQAGNVARRQGPQEPRGRVARRPEAAERASVRIRRPRRGRPPIISGRRPGSSRTSYPSGTFAYKVTATDMQGQTQTWEPFKIVASQFTVVAGAIEIKKPEP